MAFFVQQFVLFVVLFSPAHLHEFNVILADFNAGEVVYKDHPPLTRVGETTYKIASFNRDKTFCASNIRTMVGSYVEFESCDPRSTVRCVFESADVARKLFFEINEKVLIKERFPFALINQSYGQPTDVEGTSIHMDRLLGGLLIVEYNNRLVVESANGRLEAAFAPGSFNVAGPFLGGRALLLTRARDILHGSDIILRFLVKFEDRETGVRFHKYITQECSCTDASIVVDHFVP